MEAASILLPAFLAGLLIIFTHVPLGIEVLRRGIIFIDLAIAQIAGLGVIVASLYFHSHEHSIVTQVMAFIFAISSAFIFKLCEKHLPHLQEAMIGIVYVFASSVTLLLLANHPHGHEAINSLLSGQLLWVNWKEITAVFVIYLALLVLILRKNCLKKYFYIIFAITITISVQLAGVYLVFASLILPATAASIYSAKNHLFFGYIMALTALCAGLLSSFAFDLPTGPMLVCSLFFFLLVVLSLQLANRLKNNHN